ncbi:MAG: hemolysin [Pedosphaera sp. Tous-C6FEB]|nr:MAG: hemolysin [Pedosphaera sp. Tous-C6FEB]
MNASLTQPTTPTLGSRVLARSGLADRYAVRLAQDRADLLAAQTLRFLVFNVELNEGLEASYATCRDADPFDEVCDHLVVEDRASGDIVGTYRLQTGAMAAANRGFYSAGEFDFGPLGPHLPQMVELGRACVHSQHRNIAVIGLLWRNVIAYGRERGGRYLVGCSSLPTVDPAVGTAAYSQLMRVHLAPESWRTQPLPAFMCPLDQMAPEPVRIPRLLAGYFSLGAQICGPPALDREFGTIDFLTVLDLERLPANALG